MKTRQPEDLLHRLNPTEPRLAYHHSPLRSLVVTGIFLAIIAVAGFFVPQVLPLRILLALLALSMLFSLRRVCSVRIWIEWPNLVYEYRSMFRHVREIIPSWEVSGMVPHITSMWRGNISERLVLEVGERELVVTPYFSEGDPDIIRLGEEMRSLPDSRTQAEYEIELERRALFGEDEEDREPEMEDVWGLLEMSIQCPRCDGPVVVNGPFTELTCPGCSEEIDLNPSIWADLLEDVGTEIAEETEDGEGGRSTIWGTYNTTLFYGRMRPYCMKCKRDFDLEGDRREGGMIVCPDCGTGTSIRKAPDWFHKVFSGAFLIVGAADHSNDTDESAALDEPVSFTCTGCGATFKVDGRERTVKCEHCDAPVYIPDDLWLRFHPAPVKKRWFVGFRWEAIDSDEE
jgi:DNA-directed RNA polymerase subunit RPC12/RpoP